MNAIARNLPQLAILATGSVIAGLTTSTLIQHDVPVVVTVTCLLSLITSAVFVTWRYDRASRTFTCPTAGCRVRVTYGKQNDDLAFYRALATDHSRHPAVEDR